MIRCWRCSGFLLDVLFKFNKFYLLESKNTFSEEKGKEKKRDEGKIFSERDKIIGTYRINESVSSFFFFFLLFEFESDWGGGHE